MAAVVPPIQDDDPEFLDDKNISDEELLLRGLLPWQLPLGPGGPISSTAFKGYGQFAKIHRHLSAYRDGLCTPKEVFGILRQSIALASIVAYDVRAFDEVVGICDGGRRPAHARIIRNRTVHDDDWAIVANLLAEAATVAHIR